MQKEKVKKTPILEQSLGKGSLGYSGTGEKKIASISTMTAIKTLLVFSLMYIKGKNNFHR